jgi:hypothetical protein
MRALHELVEGSLVRRASEAPPGSSVDADQANPDLALTDPQHEPLGVDDPNDTHVGGRRDLLARGVALGCGMATCHDPRHEERPEWPVEMTRPLPASIRDGGTVSA